jgi:hypothetical protein
MGATDPVIPSSAEMLWKPPNAALPGSSPANTVIGCQSI